MHVYRGQLLAHECAAVRHTAAPAAHQLLLKIVRRRGSVRRDDPPHELRDVGAPVKARHPLQVSFQLRERGASGSGCPCALADWRGDWPRLCWQHQVLCHDSKRLPHSIPNSTFCRAKPQALLIRGMYHAQECHTGRTVVTRRSKLGDPVVSLLLLSRYSLHASRRHSGVRS